MAVSSVTSQASSTVFVTSTTYTGNLGGLTGADAKCQARADAAGLPGTYMAWLSDSTGSPDTRFVKSTGPYTLVDDTIIAANWDDLIDGTLPLSINLDEIGSLMLFSSPTNVWSTTASDGTRASNSHCNDWSSSLTSDVAGVASLLNAAFVPLYPDNCGSNVYRLYCFEQIGVPTVSASSLPFGILIFHFCTIKLSSFIHNTIF